MDGKGRWMDNVFIERLWRSVKYEPYSKNSTSTKLYLINHADQSIYATDNRGKTDNISNSDMIMLDVANKTTYTLKNKSGAISMCAQKAGKSGGEFNLNKPANF